MKTFCAEVRASEKRREVNFVLTTQSLKDRNLFRNSCSLPTDERLIIEVDGDQSYTDKSIIQSYKTACARIDEVNTEDAIGLINETGISRSQYQLIYTYLLYKTKDVSKARELLYEHYSIRVNSLTLIFVRFILDDLEKSFCK